MKKLLARFIRKTVFMLVDERWDGLRDKYLYEYKRDMREANTQDLHHYTKNVERVLDSGLSNIDTKVKESVLDYITTEEFVDTVVEKIRRKQI